MRIERNCECNNLGELSYGRTSQSDPKVITQNYAMTFPEYRAAIVTTPPDSQGNITFRINNPQYQPNYIKGSFESWDDYYAHHEQYIWYKAPTSFVPPSAPAPQVISTPIAPAPIATVPTPTQKAVPTVIDVNYDTASSMPGFSSNMCLGRAGYINFTSDGQNYRTLCPTVASLEAEVISTKSAPPILSVSSSGGGGPALPPIQDAFVAPPTTTINAGVGNGPWWMLAAAAGLFVVLGSKDGKNGRNGAKAGRKRLLGKNA